MFFPQQHWIVSENYVSYTIDTSRDRAFFDTDLSDPKYVAHIKQPKPEKSACMMTSDMNGEAEMARLFEASIAYSYKWLRSLCRLLYLAQQLAPAYVRVGGTGGNYLVYQLGKEKDCTRGTELGHNNITRECLNTTWCVMVLK